MTNKRFIYCDGSFGANSSKAGGWAFIEVSENKIIYEKFKAIFDDFNSSNKMELLSAIEAIKHTKEQEEIFLHSDSQFVINGINEDIFSWIKNDWKNGKLSPILYKDLWLELYDLNKKRNIKWIWVRAHSYDKYNHRVDLLAQKCYINPSKINTNIDDSHQLIFKPNIGDIIFFENPSKKYAVILNDVIIGEQTGFFARLLANSFGNEIHFFNYKESYTKNNIVTNKENRIILRTMKSFRDNINLNIENISKLN